MRVNISYSIDLNDVPAEVSEMIEKVNFRLKKEVSEELEEASSNLNIGDKTELNRIGVSLNQISKARLLLADLDSRLQDCGIMLNGYINAVQQLAIQETNERLSETQESISETIEEAREGLNEETE